MKQIQFLILAIFLRVLQNYGVISIDEKAQIEHAIGPNRKAWVSVHCGITIFCVLSVSVSVSVKLTLFRCCSFLIMPMKAAHLHQNVVMVLNEANMTPAAQFLAQKLTNLQGANIFRAATGTSTARNESVSGKIS